MKKKILGIVICMLLTVSIFPIKIISASGTTIYVDDDADPGWYDETHVKTIQEGINNASACYTVFVYNGIYYETVVVNKSVNLIGENKNNVIIDGSMGDPVVKIVQIEVSSVTIRNFTIANAGKDGYSDGIIALNVADIHISDCIFMNSSGSIYFEDVLNSSIINCNITNSLANINIFGSNNITINNCTTYNLGGPAEPGCSYMGCISIEGRGKQCSNISISNCSIYNNVFAGIYTWGSKDIEIFNNIIYENGIRGIALSDVKNIKIYENTIYNHEWEGIDCQGCLNITIHNNNISDNGNGLWWVRGGIHIDDCLDSIIENNTIQSSNRCGIAIENSQYNQIVGNNIFNSENGTLLQYCSHNNITGNIIANSNDQGIKIFISDNNIVCGNTIINSVRAIMSNSPNDINYLFHNNFVNSTNSHTHDNSMSVWDNGYPSGGNYWDDYIGNDNNEDGVGDIPYFFPEWKNDNYPLMEPKYHPSLNFPPNKPRKPSGPLVIRKNVNYSFSTSTIDINNDQVYYMWDWGDGSSSDWLGPYNSGATCAASHSWSKWGLYEIKVRAKDTNGVYSEWSQNKFIWIRIFSSFSCNVYSQSSQTIYFYDDSVILSDYEIVNWSWDFGDGNFSYTQNTSHAYSEDGIYNVTLIITDNVSASSISYQLIYIDSVLPVITNTIHTPDTVGFGFNIIIDADITDALSGIDTVKVNITYPDDSTRNFTMDNIINDTYEYIFNDTLLVGQYNYTIWAIDYSSNINSSSGHNFNVSHLYHCFGYTRLGDSCQTVADRITGSVFTVNEYGTADNITRVHPKYESITLPPGTPKTKCIIFRANDSKIIGTTEEKIGSTSIYNFSDPKPKLIKNTEYILTFWGNNSNAKIYYDDSENEHGRYCNYTYNASPSSVEFINENRIYSIYCSYTTAPAKPTLWGPLTITENIAYTYNASTIDPDENASLYYQFDWGDDSELSDWIGPFASGATCNNATHTWTEQGYYDIKVRAKDESGDISVWSDPLPIVAPFDSDPEPEVGISPSIHNIEDFQLVEISIGELNIRDDVMESVTDVIGSASEIYYYGAKIKNIGSTDIEGYLSTIVRYFDPISEQWITLNDPVNDTTPRTINKGKHLALGPIFKGRVHTRALTNGNGNYRVYAVFGDSDGNVLKCDDDTYLVVKCEFTVTGL